MFSIPNDIENLHETGVYHQIVSKLDQMVPMKWGPWNARPRRKKVTGTVDGVTITRSLHRDHDSWTVRFEASFVSEDFRADFEEVLAWDFPPDQPFPYTTYEQCSWDQSAHDFGLRLSGSIEHFLMFVGVSQETSLDIIAVCEDDGLIDEHDATIARLRLAA